MTAPRSLALAAPGGPAADMTTPRSLPVAAPEGPAATGPAKPVPALP
jgi:hypothetical protein